MKHLMTTYKPLMQITRGAGCYVWDAQGKKYLDTIAAVAVCNLGHCHPAITKTIQEQAGILVHCSNLVSNPYQEQLASKLVELSGLKNVFFGNSGAEANEAAIKLARLFGTRKGLAHPKIIVMERAFHGRTLATLSASGNAKIQVGYTPLVEGFIRAPYNNVHILQQLLQQHQDIVAIMLEPVQGEAGVVVPADDYLAKVRALCDEYDCLMILDEIQSGMGRTGKWFAYQHTGIEPDIVTLAKGLGNGIPIGACIAGNKAKDLFQPGSHGSTFGGNPLVTSVALSVINTIERENLLANAAAQGERLITQLRAQLSELPQVLDIRGLGLWVGIELSSPCAKLVADAQAQGFLLNVTQENVIRLAPPFIINSEEIDRIVDMVCGLVKSSKA